MIQSRSTGDNVPCVSGTRLDYVMQTRTRTEEKNTKFGSDENAYGHRKARNSMDLIHIVEIFSFFLCPKSSPSSPSPSSLSTNIKANVHRIRSQFIYIGIYFSLARVRNLIFSRSGSSFQLLLIYNKSSSKSQ